MITLNKIANAVFLSAERHNTINWCTSHMAIICRISVIWRKLFDVDRGFGKSKNKEIKRLVAGIIEQCIILLLLCGESDVEGVIKEYIDKEIYKNNKNG